jgi:hypothetical protein
VARYDSAPGAAGTRSSGVRADRPSTRKRTWVTSGSSTTRIGVSSMPLVASEPEHRRVEQAHAVAEQDGGDVDLELVQQAGSQHLRQQRASARDGHVLPAGRLPRLVDGGLDPIGDVGEAGAPLAVEHLAGPVRDDEDRGVERGLVAPGHLAPVRHPPPHHVGAGRGERLLQDLGVGVAFAALEAQALAPRHGAEHPAGDPEEPGGLGAVDPVVRVILLGPGVEPVERDRHLCGDQRHRKLLCRVRHRGWMRHARVGATRRSSTSITIRSVGRHERCGVTDVRQNAGGRLAVRAVVTGAAPPARGRPAGRRDLHGQPPPAVGAVVPRIRRPHAARALGRGPPAPGTEGGDRHWTAPQMTFDSDPIGIFRPFSITTSSCGERPRVVR